MKHLVGVALTFLGPNLIGQNSTSALWGIVGVVLFFVGHMIVSWEERSRAIETAKERGVIIAAGSRITGIDGEVYETAEDVRVTDGSSVAVAARRVE